MSELEDFIDWLWIWWGFDSFNSNIISIWKKDLIRLYKTWIKKSELEVLFHWRSWWWTIIDWWACNINPHERYSLIKNICEKYWLVKDFFNIMDSYEDHLEYMKSKGNENKIINLNQYWYVYFIKDSNWFVKVWKTNNKENRIKKYITENANPIDVLKIIQYEDYHKAEKRWHKILKQFNHNREWFNISEDIVEKIVQCNDWCFITVN